MNRAIPSVLFSSAKLAALALHAAGLTACVGTTGSDLVTFDAAAAGPADAVKGQDYKIPKATGYGYEVTLSKASLHIGAVYLNSAAPISGAGDTVCVLNGLYVGQVTGGLDVDVLDPTPQPFPVQGQGTETRAIVGEVWLMHGDVNATGDQTPILQIKGTASRNGTTYPFEGQVTIDENRVPTVVNQATPGANPICKRRIVSPIHLASDITPRNGGSLLLRIDPYDWFGDVDFSRLTSTASPPLYEFADTENDTESTNLYNGIRDTSASGAYDFFWIDSPNP